MTKTCNECKLPKEPSQFYKDKSRKDGLSGTCKQCSNARTNRWIEAHREQVNANHSDWLKAHPDRKRETSKAWLKAHPEQVREREKSYRAKFPEKYRARQAVKYALKVGKLTRQPCETCGDVNSQAHHDDYSKPLGVKWLCQKHHDEHHNKIHN